MLEQLKNLPKEILELTNCDFCEEIQMNKMSPLYTMLYGIALDLSDKYGTYDPRVPVITKPLCGIRIVVNDDIPVNKYRALYKSGKEEEFLIESQITSEELPSNPSPNLSM